jgi:hypothetical protein
VEDAYRREKIEGARIRNLQTRGQLLDRTAVVQRLTVLYQSVVGEFDRLVRDVGPLLANKSEMQVRDILGKERAAFVRKLREIPSEIQLPESAMAAYQEFFRVLSDVHCDDDKSD